MIKRRQLNWKYLPIVDRIEITQCLIIARLKATMTKGNFYLDKPIFLVCIYLLFGCLQTQSTVHAQSLPLFTLNEEFQSRMEFNDSLLFFQDKNGDLSIEEVIMIPYDLYVSTDALLKSENKTYIWTKFKLYNEGSTTLHMYFSYCLEAFGFWIYELEGDRIVNQQYVGKDQTRKDRIFANKNLFAPISLDPRTERTYLIKVQFTEEVDPIHATHLSLRPTQLTHHFTMGQFAWNAFYAGGMFLFLILSLFLFAIFKQKSFVYFAMQTFFFVLYFIEMSGMVEGLFTNFFQIKNVYIIEWVISGLLISGFLFIAEFLQVRHRLRVTYMIYASCTFFFAIYMFVGSMLNVPYLLRAQSYNLLLPFWIILSGGIILYLSRKGYREARILLLSAGVLLLGSLFYLVVDLIAATYSSLGFGLFQFGTMLSSGILFYSLFDKINHIRREKLQMEELDKLKSKFFENISHEFRTPLTLIMGPLQQLMEETDDPKSLELLTMAKRNAERQLALVNQLLELSTFDTGEMELGAEVQDFVPFLKGVVHAYASLATQKGISLKVDCPDKVLSVFFNPEKMESIFYNLLSNAFKFTNSGGAITVKVFLNKKQVCIELADTGVGIHAEELPYIFNRFFQAKEGLNSVEKGSGIGLALTKELVILHGGTISVESELGKGTVFSLQFPLAEDYVIYENEEEEPTQGPVVLLIEDNQDVRYFIRQRLSGEFHIEESSNGKEGVLRAQELMPDLIISDVMMPELDGYQVCKILKTDLRTCHIPIILLTAKASTPEKLEGLEIGADDYLTKPFDATELLLRCQNLIRSRQLLRQRFASAISIKANEIAATSRDKEFLDLVVQKIENGIKSEGFRTDDLAAAVGMSKPNLNKKLRALVDQSTNQFIQSIRLQQAAELLRQDAGTVAEIAIQTGFSSTAYFVKCFKDKYGETPGSYNKNTSPIEP